MISSLALVLAFCQTQVPEQASASTGLRSGAALITAMLDRYSNARSITATVHMTQEAMNKTIGFVSVLAYQRPDKIYFVQKRDRGNETTKLISDGINFVYTAPSNVDTKRITEFRESVHPKQGDLNIQEMWATVKPALENGDENFVLDAMVSRMSDLRQIVPQLKTFTNTGKVQLNGHAANLISGVWRDKGFGQTGTFQMYVTDEGDLMRLQVKMSFAIDAKYLRDHHLPMTAFPDGVEVNTVWDVDSAVNVAPNPGLFKLQ